MMRTLCRISTLCLLALGGLVLSQNVLKADTQGWITFTSSPGGGIYDPYSGTYSTNSGVPASGAPQNLVASSEWTLFSCDDFADHISAGETWDVNTYTLNQLALAGAQYFPAQNGGVILNPNSVSSATTSSPGAPSDESGASVTLADVTADYYAAAWLAEQMNNNPGNSTLDANDSLALWDIFEPFAATGAPPLSAGVLTQLQLAFSKTYNNGSALTGAQAIVDAELLSDVRIFTPVLPSYNNFESSTFSKGGEDPQEFLAFAQGGGSVIVSPEASTLAFLGLNLLALPGILFFARRRSRRVE